MEVACPTGLAIETGGGGLHDSSYISHLGIQVYIDASNQEKVEVVSTLSLSMWVLQEHKNCRWTEGTQSRAPHKRNSPNSLYYVLYWLIKMPENLEDPTFNPPLSMANPFPWN